MQRRHPKQSSSDRLCDRIVSEVFLMKKNKPEEISVPDGLVDLDHPMVLALLGTKSRLTVWRLARQGKIPSFQESPRGKYRICIPILREHLHEQIRKSVKSVAKKAA